MTIKTTDIRLDKQIGGFDFDFRVLLESKGKAVLGSGMRPSFCRVLIGARKEIVLIL